MEKGPHRLTRALLLVGEYVAKDGCDKDGGDGHIAGGLRWLVRRGAVLRRDCAGWYGGEQSCGGIALRGTEGGNLAAGLFRVVRRGVFRVWG